jgi:hypothetical protein
MPKIIVSAVFIFTAAFSNALTPEEAVNKMTPGTRMCGHVNQMPCCECSENFGYCSGGGTGGDEDPFHGCANQGFSCADDCPGDYEWKTLYRDSLKKTRAKIEACDGDPTKNWLPAEPGGRYAVAFSGGMRNFISTIHSWITNVIEPSGGDNVDLYFHVFADETSGMDGVMAREAIRFAKSLPNTKAFVHEPFRGFWDYLNSDLPHARTNVSTSWLGDVEKDFAHYPGGPRPYRIGASYSQFRKVNKVHELIKQSGVRYSLIVRSRPDVTFLEPLDLRELERDMRMRKSVQNANGHFIIIPERSVQIIVDHFAIGTHEAMMVYATPQNPYIASCCEAWVERNLVEHCFARTDAVVNDEFKNLPLKAKAFEDHAKQFEPRAVWPLVPKESIVDKWSPIMNNWHNGGGIGLAPCMKGGGLDAKCVPIYRTRFTYVFRANVASWFQMGIMCIMGTNEGHVTGPFLIETGIASKLRPDLNERFRDGPCLEVIPALLA